MEGFRGVLTIVLILYIDFQFFINIVYFNLLTPRLKLCP